MELSKNSHHNITIEDIGTVATTFSDNCKTLCGRGYQGVSEFNAWFIRIGNSCNALLH